MAQNKNRKLKSAQEMIELYESMDDARKQSLSDFAEFLYDQADPVVKEIPPPADIPRPDQETVVGAIKRLKQAYHMVESTSVFSAASSLMTEHMIKGRDSVEVIDEMEILFEKAYNKLLDDSKK